MPRGSLVGTYWVPACLVRAAGIRVVNAMAAGWFPTSETISQNRKGRLPGGTRPLSRRSIGPLDPSCGVNNQGHDQADQKDEEQDLRNSRRSAGDPAETKNARNERDNQK